MSLFIHDAYAAGSSAPQYGDQYITAIIFAVLMAFFWFIFVRPSRKRDAERERLTIRLSKGDEVVALGGLLGRVKDPDGQIITLEVAPGVDLRIQRQAVNVVMPKDTFKNHLK